MVGTVSNLDHDGCPQIHPPTNSDPLQSECRLPRHLQHLHVHQFLLHLHQETNKQKEIHYHTRQLNKNGLTDSIDKEYEYDTIFTLLT